MFTSFRIVALACTLGLLGACSDPVSTSSPISLNDKIKSGDVKSGTGTLKKSVTSESGNPWSAFIKDTRDQLGGDPGDIELLSASLTLSTESKGVTSIGEVFAGAVDVQFEMNDSNNIYPVAGTTVDAEAGRTVELMPDFDFSSIAEQDREKLFNGSFDVILTGPVVAGFESADAEAAFQMSFVFESFE